MCKPDKCNNCENCPAKRVDWRLQATQEDLKLEVVQRFKDALEYVQNASPDVNELYLDNLLDEIKYVSMQCNKVGVTFDVEDL